MRAFRLSYILAPLALTACDESTADPVDEPPISTPARGAVAGLVTDTASQPLGDVAVSGAKASTTTAADGSFALELDVGNHVLVFRRQGFVKSAQQVTPRPDATSFLPVTLIAEAAPQPLDATSGGEVHGVRSTRLVAAPGAFVDGAGQPVSGTVEVSLTPMDPSVTEELAAYPGDLVGQTLQGELILLQTYGVVDVTVRQGGEELQVAPGKSVELRGPALSHGFAPAETRTWTYDDTLGRWVENDNTATYDAATNTYTTTATHFSPFNWDGEEDPSCLTGYVQDQEGNAVIGAVVRAHSTSPSITTSSTSTDLDGSFCVTAARDGITELSVYDHYGRPTSRVVATSKVRSAMPPDCGHDACRYVPTITLDTPDPGTGVEDAACDEPVTAENPFAGTCATELGDLFACFAPAGDCFYETEALTYTTTITYENGARIETSLGPFGMESVLWAASGDECGRITGNEWTTRFVAPSGDSFELKRNENGSMQVTCPGGYSFTVTPEQADMLALCGAMTDSGGEVSCRPAPGTRGADCQLASDCNDQMGCCGNWLPSICLPPGQCEFYEQNGCVVDANCSGRLERCCDVGLFRICTPTMSCD